MSYIPALYGYVDPNNSTTTPLGANAVFTGTATNCVNYSVATIYVASDQSSANLGFVAQFSNDGTNWDIRNGSNVDIGLAGTVQGQSSPFPIQGKFFRIERSNFFIQYV